jgi:hypothetical protein
MGGNISYLATDYKNDLWMYCTATNNWSWIRGDLATNPAGNYGTLGVSSPLNMPPGRMGHNAWRASSGELYLFGGTTYPFGSFQNDMWKFTIDPACAFCNSLPVALFNAPNHICPGTCTDFTNISLNATSYLWLFPGANPSSSTDANPVNICYPAPGTYSVTLIATNPTGSDTLTLNNYMTVYPYPSAQGITQSGDTLFANQGATGYQWYFAGNLIPGATDYFYVATQSGNYNVVATDANGCEVEAVIFDVIASVTGLIKEDGSLHIFPNPAGNEIVIKCEPAETITGIRIMNTLGEVVFTSEEKQQEDYLKINIERLAGGIYFVEAGAGKKILRSKFVKQ